MNNQFEAKYQTVPNTERVDNDTVQNIKPTRVFQLPQEVEYKYILRISDPKRVIWDLFVMLLAIWNSFSIPVFIAFEPEVADTPGMVACDFIIDFCFFTDILLNFRTSYISMQDGKEITNPKMIAINYVKQGPFAIDLLSTIPVDNIALAAGNSNGFFNLFGLLKLFRIFRLGCIFYILIKADQEWTSTTDGTRLPASIYNKEFWYKYWMIFYTSVFMLIGAEVNPVTTFDHFYCGTMIISGALISAVMFGEMALVMDNLNRKTNEFNTKLDSTSTAMKNINLPTPLEVKIMEYVIQTSSVMQQQDEFLEFFVLLSPSLQQEINSTLYSHVIENNQVIKQDNKVQGFLINRLQCTFTNPEVLIIDIDNDPVALYFIVSGIYEAIIYDQFHVEHKVREMKQGDIFGEIGLIYNTSTTATVKSLKYSRAALLNKEDVQMANSLYPEFAQNLKSYSSRYKDHWRCFLMKLTKMVPYLANLKGMRFNQIIYALKKKNYSEGAKLVQEGEPITHIYFVIQGEVQVTLSFKGQIAAQLQSDQDWQRQKSMQGSKSSARSNTFFSKLSQQKLCLENLSQGSIIGMKQALVGKESLINIETDQGCTVLQLSYKTLQKICQNDTKLKAEVELYRSEQFIYDHEYQAYLVNVSPLDYEVLPSTFRNNSMYLKWSLQKVFKIAAVKVLQKVRNAKSKGIPNISTMIDKLRAMILAEEIGLEDLARKIARGDVIPEAVYAKQLLDDSEVENPIKAQYGYTAVLFMNAVDTLNNKLDAIDHHLKSQKNIITQVEPMLGDVEDLIEQLEKKYNIYNP